MQGPLDSALMRRGKAARELIRQGEDPFRMLAAVVWPGRDWRDEALLARLVPCAACVGDVAACLDCGGLGIVSITGSIPIGRRSRRSTHEAPHDTPSIEQVVTAA